MQDTPDFLCHIDALDNIPEGSILCTVDVSALYTNINMEDAMAAVKRALDTREDQTVPTDFIVKLLEMVLKWNIFTFDSQLYQQLIGFAMGTKCAPNVADLFMAEIDEKILDLAAQTDGDSPISFYRRFLDDIFMLFTDSSQDLHQFVSEINTIHPGIKFTMSHTTPATPDCDCEAADSIPFLDTSIKIKDGQLVTDLYRKPTDRNQ